VRRIITFTHPFFGAIAFSPLEIIGNETTCVLGFMSSDPWPPEFCFGTRCPHLIWAARMNLSSMGFDWWRWQLIFLLHNRLLLLSTGAESCLMILRSAQLERLYRSGSSCRCGGLWCGSGAGGCHII